MKKIYLAFLFAALSLGVHAQCTPASNITSPGYFPAALDTVAIGVPYSMVISLRIPTDTSVTVLGQTIKADIDSIRLTAIVGLPAGFNYQCNVPRCLFRPNQTYCAILTGTATAQQRGVYPLKFNILGHASAVVFGTLTRFPAQPDTIRNFSLVVGKNSVGIFETNTAKPLQLYPNPTNGSFTVGLAGHEGETVNYSVSDITGRVVIAESITLGNDNMILGTINESITKGVYLVQVKTSKGIYTERLLVE